MVGKSATQGNRTESLKCVYIYGVVSWEHELP